MIAGSSSAGRVVLELTLDASPARRGLSAAKAETIRETAQLKNALRLQYQVDLLKLRAGFREADRESASSKRRVEQQLRYQASIDLARFKSDLRMAEAEQRASQRRMAQQPQQAGLGWTVAGGAAAGVGFAAVSAGFGLIRQGAEAARGGIFDFNASIEDATDTIGAFQKSNQGLADQLAAVDRATGKPVFGVRALTDAVAQLQPVVQRSGESVDELLRLTQILAGLNPREGLGGAAFAIGELFSGDVTSIVERFNVPRRELQRLREQGVPEIEALRRVLAEMGVDFDLVARRADNFSTRLRAALEGGAAAAGQTFRPAFEGVSDLLAEITDYLNSPEVQRAGAGFAAGLAQDIAELRQFLGRGDVQETLRDLAGGLKEGAIGAADLARNLGTALAPAAGAGARALGALDSQAAQSAITYALATAALVKLYQGIVAIQAAGGIRAIFAGVNTGLVAPLAAAGLSLVAVNESAKTLTGSTMPDLIASVIKYGDAWARGREEADKALGRVRAGADPAAELKRLRDEERRARGMFEGLQNYDPQGPGEFLALGPAQLKAAADWENARKALEQYQLLYRQFVRETNYPSTARGMDERLDESPLLPPTTPGRAPLPPPTGGPDEGREQDEIARALLNARLGEQAARDYAASLAQLRQAFASFGADEFDLFERLRPQVQAGFQNLFGDLDPGAQVEEGLLNLDNLTAALVADLRDYGAVSEETATRVRAALGGQAQGVLDLAGRYGELATATERAATAADDLEAAQDGLTAAQRDAADNADRYRESVAALQRDLSDLSQEAADVARGYADRLDALREERAAATELAEAHRRSFREQIDGLASVQAAKAKSEAVQNLTDEQDATLLSFEQRIRAARRPGGAGEAAARALEEERDRFLARSRYAIQLAELEAEVAQNAADTEVAGIEEAAAAQAAKDQDAAAAIDERIGQLEDEAAQAARDYAERQRAIQALIDEEEERARVVGLADKAAVDAAQDRVDSATTAKRLADEELVAAGKIVTALGEQNTAIQNRINDQKEFVNWLKSQGIPVDKYFGGGGSYPAYPDAPVPGGGGGGGTLSPGDTLRGAPGLVAARYAPPVPPAPYVGGWAMAGGTGGATLLRAGGGPVTIQGPFASFPNATIRETVDIERAIEGGARLALEALRDAQREDADGGGAFSSWDRR